MLLLVLASAAAREGRALRLLRGEPSRDFEPDLSSPDDLWDGSDADAALASAVDQLWSVPNVSSAVALGVNRTAGRHPAMHMYGLFNTGTNLLFDLIGKNFKAYQIEPFKQSQPGWKHAKPSVYFANNPHLKPQAGDVMVVMIRDPMSWLMSMRKAPYNLQSCTVGSDWTTRPCTMSCDAACLHTHRGPKSFANIEDVWNSYMQDYEASSRYGYGKVVLVRYEDLVMQPGVELRRIGDALGIQPAAQVVHQLTPAKNHGMSLGRAQAMEKLRSKSYLHMYGNGDRSKACARLDKPMMQRHGYRDCSGW